ncbi:MAG: carbohydrate porin [Opitutaceae bacterium]|nr:carbohydrate porin [Opitutaceae bacterium]
MSRSPQFAPILASLFLASLSIRAGEAPVATVEPSAFAPSLTVTGELWDNVSGGLRAGSHWNTLIDLGLELDLAPLGGPPGGSLFAQVLWVENRHSDPNFGDHTGGANPVSGSLASDQLRVFNLFYRQSWAHGRYALKLGQLALDDDFMGSAYAGLFAHSALGALPSQVATPHAFALGGGSAYPIYAVAAPGAHFSAAPNGRVSLQLGAYHGGPGPDERANHGFDWDDGSGQGLVVFYEGSYSSTLGDRASTLRAGGALHSGSFADFTAFNAGVENATVRGIHSFYVIHDLVLLAADAEHPRLAVFWRAGLSPQQDRSVVHRYTDAGLNWFGPLPGRADDIAGIALSYTEYGRAFRRTDAALAAAETAVELTYRAQLATSFVLQAFIQRHFNPLPRDDGRRHPATVLGLRAEWSY